jgi:NADH-quinone oxidoreductase subunit J
MFFILAVVILASAVLCVTTKRIMRAATFLLFVLFGIAGLYFLLDYTYLGAAQIAVYAGGVTMIYIFAIQLVSKQTLQGMVERMKGSRVAFGALVALIGLLTTAVVFVKNHFYNNFMLTGDKEVSMKEIGNALVGADKFGYVLPFEFISIFLLACIIGGIMISRKE